jgi:hypothetical protein
MHDKMYKLNEKNEKNIENEKNVNVFFACFFHEKNVFFSSLEVTNKALYR